MEPVQPAKEIESTTPSEHTPAFDPNQMQPLPEANVNFMHSKENDEEAPLGFDAPPNNFQPPIAYDMGPMKQENFTNLTDQSIQFGFARKVLALVGIQLMITLGAVCLSVFVTPFAEFQQKTSWLFFTVFVLLIVLMIVIFYSRRITKRYPYNYMLMFLFVLLMSYVVSALASFYEPTTVVLAVFTCAVLTLSLMLLTLIVSTKKLMFCALGGILICIPLILCMFFFLFLDITIAHTIYCLIGTIIYGCYLVFDLTMIMKPQKNKYSLGPDDFVIASLLIYIDIVMIFLFILSLFGKK